jgi:hypothetical protein
MPWLAACALALVTLIAAPDRVFAQGDEIQVYDGGLAAPGVFNLTVHNNFTPSGLATPAFPGTVASHHSLNGVPEWAYGVTSWFEAGLYLPLYSRDETLGWSIDGVKLRTLFAVPDADSRTFFYGANFEFSYNAKRWDTTRFTSEIRPIVGWHLHPVDVIVNPILDTSYDGLGHLIFAPSVRVAYNVSPLWAVAVEEYGDYGPLHQFHGVSEQSQQLFGVFDYAGKFMNVEGGVGFGLTESSDNFTLKLILSRDFNKGR